MIIIVKSVSICTLSIRHLPSIVLFCAVAVAVAVSVVVAVAVVVVVECGDASHGRESMRER